MRSSVQGYNLQRRVEQTYDIKTKIQPKEINSPVISSLGNMTSYSDTLDKPVIQEININEIKLYSKIDSIKVKKVIGKYNRRVKKCGWVRINRNDTSQILVIKGEKGTYWYNAMQRCGLIWLCPDCNYKIMKARANELYEQLKIEKDRGNSVLFVTFTLQHNSSDKLDKLLELLQGTFNKANTNYRAWLRIKKDIEYLRTLEITHGNNGFHPHYHCLFVGGTALLENINILTDAYKSELNKLGLTTNEYTTTIELWNGNIDDMKDYLFKGLLERELTSGGLKKGKKNSKTFFELVADPNTPSAVIQEYVTATKGKKMYHSSKGFFKDVRVQADEEILHDDKAKEIVCMIPYATYMEMSQKDMALEFLAEISYHGITGARDLLILYDIDDSFMEDPPPLLQLNTHLN